MDCPLCQAADHVVGHVGEFILAGEAIRQETRICRACSLVFESAEPNLEWSSLYGSVWYRSSLPNAKQTELYARDAGLIGPPAHAGERVFDIGCGRGLLLDELSALGWITAGCDPEADAIETARLKGHSVTAECFEPRPDFESDLVILGDVLEHVADPLSMLRDVRQILRPGGRFYVRVPDLEEVNFDTFGDVFGLQHRIWFTRDTLREALAFAGFEVCFDGKFARGMHAMARIQSPRAWSCPKGEPARSVEIVRNYSRDMAVRRARIASRLESLRGREVALYGGGEHAEELLRFSALGGIATRVVDSNESLWGNACGALTIETPAVLRDRPPESVVIASKAYQNEIAAGLEDLAERGVDVIRLYAESG